MLKHQDALVRSAANGCSAQRLRRGPGSAADRATRRWWTTPRQIRGMIERVAYLLQVEESLRCDSTRSSPAASRKPREARSAAAARRARARPRPRPQGPARAQGRRIHKAGFEGGQMPLQRRLPKSASRRRRRRAAEVRLDELAKARGRGRDRPRRAEARRPRRAADRSARKRDRCRASSTRR